LATAKTDSGLLVGKRCENRTASTQYSVLATLACLPDKKAAEAWKLCERATGAEMNNGF